MVNISTYNLHVCHNASQKDLRVFGKDLSGLVIGLYIWFKLSASRREEYEEVQIKLGLPAHTFLKHFELTEAVVQRCSVKKVFLNISQNSQEHNCARVSFLINFRPKAHNIIKKGLWHRCFPVNFANFSRKPFFL